MRCDIVNVNTAVMTMEKPSVMLDKEAPVKGIVAQVVTMLNQAQATRYVFTKLHWNLLAFIIKSSRSELLILDFKAGLYG